MPIPNALRQPCQYQSWHGAPSCSEALTFSLGSKASKAAGCWWRLVSFVTTNTMSTTSSAKGGNIQWWRTDRLPYIALLIYQGRSSLRLGIHAAMGSSAVSCAPPRKYSIDSSADGCTTYGEGLTAHVQFIYAFGLTVTPHSRATLLRIKWATWCHHKAHRPLIHRPRAVERGGRGLHGLQWPSLLPAAGLVSHICLLANKRWRQPLHPSESFLRITPSETVTCIAASA